MSKYVTFFKTYSDRDWPVDALRQYVASKGYGFREISTPRHWKHSGEIVSLIRNSAALFVWHGEDPGCEWAVKVAKAADVPVTYVEWGHFPRRERMRFDRSGFGPASHVCAMDYMPDVTPEQIERAKAEAAQFLRQAGYGWNPSLAGDTRQVVVPLQTDWASATHVNVTMPQLVQKIVQCFPGNPVAYVPHPQDKSRVIDIAGVTCREPPLLRAIGDAAIVAGLSSNALLEAALIAFAFGTGPSVYPTTTSPLDGDSELVLTELLTQQFPCGVDMTPYLAHVGIAL